MIKNIKVLHENILAKFPDYQMNGEGKISFKNVAATDSPFIILVLRTLGVEFEEKVTRAKERSLFEYVFKISDIRQECPMLYEKWHKMDQNTLEDGLPF